MKRRKRRYRTEVYFDIETTEWSKVLCVCAVTSTGGRFSSVSIDSHVEACMDEGLFTPDTRHWAHYGGIFDFLLVIPYALRNGWRIARAMVDPGGKLWSCDLERDGHMWCLRDSSRIAPNSVKEIGDAYGLPKLEYDRENLANIPLHELFEYCYRDCDIIAAALSEFSALMNEYGHELGDTLAGSAARIAAERMNDRWGISQDADAVGQAAYAGGRVERFARSGGASAVYDINSAYPWAMTGVLPTYYAGSGTGAPPTSPELLSIVTARVRVERSAEFGPLFYRPPTGPLSGRLVFPTGEWTGTYTLEELEAACETGECSYEPILWHSWQSSAWLEDLVGDWYTRRRQSTSEATKFAYKILLNSLYGKFIESPEGQTFTSDRSRAIQAEEAGSRVSTYELDEFGTGEFVLYGIHGLHTGPIRHAPTAAHVTGRVRTKLLRAMRAASTVHYCDTDSIVGNADIADSKALGAWKLERAVNSCEFLASKLYRLETDSGPIVKAKGYARGQGAVDMWDRIVNCEPVERQTTVLFRSLLRRGDLEFARDSLVRKRLGGLDKRMFYESGHSRPWTVAELSAL